MQICIIEILFLSLPQVFMYTIHSLLQNLVLSENIPIFARNKSIELWELSYQL